MSIIYVVSCYLGNRRVGVVDLCQRSDKLYFIKKQITQLNSLSVPHIKKILLTVNIQNESEICLINDYLKTVESNIPIQVLYNENKGFSYKAWETAIYNTINEPFDYYFFIEDDYIPIKNYFYLFFLDQMNEYTGYVCELVFTDHASGPNGIMKKTVLMEIFAKYGRFFDLNDNAKSYVEGENNQRNFLNFMVNIGYILKDITPNVNVHRIDRYGKIARFGHTNRNPVISPIYCTQGVTI